MDLHCNEATCIKRAYLDPVLVVDDRVLQNMLQTETYYMTQNDYFTLVQKELRPHMRKIVSEWMLEVCDEQRCEEDVFPLAMNYLDRFLSIVPIGKMQLQLLGAVCMLVSSKLKETCPINPERLVMYTDHSISLSELLQWEHLLLMRLKWDLSAITPLDFLEQILQRLPELHQCSPTQIMTVKRHAKTFIALCATDFRFARVPPSIVAAASILAAINGFQIDVHLDILVERIQCMLSIEKDFIVNCKDLIEQTLKQHLVQSASGRQDLPQTTSTETTKGATTGQPTTPTDVRDINIYAM